MIMLRKYFPVLIGSLGALLVGQPAMAQCCNVSRGHQIRVPGVVISQPRFENGCQKDCAPPPCKEDCSGGGGGGGKSNFNWRGSFDFEATATATATAQSQAAANAQARSNAFSNSVAFGLGGAINGSAGFGGGGGGGGYVGSTSSYIPSLGVEAEATAAVQVAYQDSRTVVKTVVLQAFCVDDKLVPHPASQVTPGRDVSDTYEGELYRCLAGTYLQYTLSESADAGKTGRAERCVKGQALHYGAGQLACRSQKAARDCNERSLLRRYGAGMKLLRVSTTETFTAYRTEFQSASASAAGAGMYLDGGVGGVIY